MQTPYIGSGTSNAVSSHTLRDEVEDRQRLEKSNFDLKMKILHLEDGLKRMQDANASTPAQYSSSAATNFQRGSVAEGYRSNIISPIYLNEVNFQAENINLRMKIEEKQIELEHRNALLVKAKHAIEALKTELHRLQEQKSYDADLEERVRKLKEVNDEIEVDYREQLARLESELFSARLLVNNKEKERMEAEEKLRQRESAHQAASEKASALQTDNHRLQEALSKAQQTASSLSDELTQCKAHLDLYKMQLEEEGADRDALKQKLKEMANEFDFQTKSARQSHLEEIEKLRASYSQTISSVQEQSRVELAQSRSQLMSALQEAQSLGLTDAARAREEALIRLSEQSAELRSLRLDLDSERTRSQSLAAELTAARQEAARSESAAVQVQETLNAERKMNAFKVEQLASELQAAKDGLDRRQADLTSLTLAKQEVTSLSEKLAELGHLRDLSLAEMERREKDIQQLRDRLTEADRRNIDLASSLEAVKRDVEEGKKVQLDLQSQRDALQRQTEVLSEQNRDLQQHLGQACERCLSALHSWDQLLSIVLDGEGHTDGISAHHPNPYPNPTSLLKHSKKMSLEERDLAKVGMNKGKDADNPPASPPVPAVMLQQLLMAMERMEGKLARVRRIRQLFEGQVGQHVDRSERLLEECSDRLSALASRCGQGELRLTEVRATLDRDTRQKDFELREMKAFREKLFADQTARIQHADERITQLTQQLEDEKRTAKAATDDLTRLSQENTSLQADLQEARRGGQELSAVAERLAGLSDRYDELRGVLQSREQEVRALTADKASLQATVSSLQSSLYVSEKALRDMQRKCAALTEEADQLRAQQIDPQLQQTIRDTQKILQLRASAAIEEGSDRLHLRPPSGPSSHPQPRGRSRDESSHSDGQTAELARSLENLVRRSSELLARYFDWSAGLADRGVSSHQDLRTLSQDIHSLLEANRMLAGQLQQSRGDPNPSDAHIALAAEPSRAHELPATQSAASFLSTPAFSHVPQRPLQQVRSSSDAVSLHRDHYSSPRWGSPVPAVPSVGLSSSSRNYLHHNHRQGDVPPSVPFPSDASYYQESFLRAHPRPLGPSWSSSFLPSSDPLPSSAANESSSARNFLSRQPSEIQQYASSDDPSVREKVHLSHTGHSSRNLFSSSHHERATAVPVSAASGDDRMDSLGSELQELARKLDALDKKPKKFIPR